MGKLTKQELQDTSGAGRESGQVQWLEEEGIPYRRNRKGELVVLWCHIQQWVEGKPSVRFVGPDFSSLRT